MHVKVFADMRWPPTSGIGRVQDAYIQLKPRDIELIDLRVVGKIGHPLSPLRIMVAFMKAAGPDDLFWSAGFMPPLLFCRRSIVFVHDLTHLTHYTRLKRLYYNIVLKPLYRRCAAIVCVSDFVRSEFLLWSKMDASKVHVFKNAVSKTFLENTSSASLGFKYVLYPGNHRTYKNLERLIEGYAKSGIADRGIHLVFTGSENSALRSLAKGCGVGEKLHFIGAVPLGEIQKVYRGAEAIAFVSLFEGFGLPILEGMASSVPVVTSNVTSMPEIAGDAALIVDPYSVDEIAAALKLVISNESLRQTLVERGRARAMQFSWDRSADRFWALIRRCAEQQAQAGSPKLQVKG